MLNLIWVLFLIFGWIFNIKGLVIASLVLSSLFLIATLAVVGHKGKSDTGNDIAMLIQIVCLCLSIIKLCL